MKKWKDLPKKKKIFYARMTGFAATGFVAPITYLIARYHLFTQQSSTNIGLWGVICFAMVVAFAGILCYYYLEGMKYKYTIVKQIVSGAVKIIGPLLVLQLLLNTMRNDIPTFQETLWVFIGCEAAAIPLNPLPKYAFENNIKGFSELFSRTTKKAYKDIKKEEQETPKESK